MVGFDEKKGVVINPCGMILKESRMAFAFLIGVLLCVMTVGQSLAGTLLASWNPNTETDLAGYRIYYGTEAGIYSVTIDVGDTTRYMVENLIEGRTYYFAVTAYDYSGNESVPSQEVAAAVDGPIISIQLVEDGIGLSWQSVSSAVSYKIYRDSLAYFVPQSELATVTGSNYVDTSHPRTPGLGSYYVVRAFNANGDALYTYNRVGAFNIPVKTGNNLVSIPIIPADSSLTKVIGTQLTGGSNPVMSDKILLWDGVKYNIAWLLEGTSSPLEGKWLTEAGDRESPLTVVPDISFWIHVRNFHDDSLVTISGAVANDSDRPVTLGMGPNFIGTTYPVQISLDSSELYEDDVVTGSTFSAGSDKLLSWTGNLFDSAWLFESPNSSLNGTWLNESGSGPTTIQFVPGKGYVLWIKNQNPNQIWTFPNPDPNL